MQKQIKGLFLITVLLAVVVGALLFIEPKKEPIDKPTETLLIKKEINDVLNITVENETDEFTVSQEDGGFSFSNVDVELLNIEYLQQLIADSAFVEYIELVKENTNELDVFGLEDPVSKVAIQYKNNETLNLWVGNPGPIENTRYVLDSDSNNVYLFEEAATIRFTMSIERYLDYVIVPPHEVADVMKTIQSVTYRGTMLNRPIVIQKIDEDDPTQLRVATSFGVASHLMVKPTLQKLDLKEANDQFSALVGLLSYGIEAYNTTLKTQNEYGFNNPDLLIDFEFSPNGEVEPIPYQLKVVKKEGEHFVMVNNNGVIHKIENEAFLSLSYETLISRWFYTPLLLDVDQLRIEINQKEYVFNIQKLSKNDISVTVNNQSINTDLFRKFYNLVVSASHDGTYQPFTLKDQAKLMEIEFSYIDNEKSNDVVQYYAGDTRRNNVCYANVCDFVIKDNYIEYIQNAITSLINGDDFRVDWQ